MFLLEAVDWAMAMEPDQRPQGAGELLDALRGCVGVLPHARVRDPASEPRSPEPIPGGGDDAPPP